MKRMLIGLSFLLVPTVAGADERPTYYEREITEKDLENRSLRELSLMRNEIYARQGWEFHKFWLKDHFKKQKWYKPGNFDIKKLSKIDRRNADRIARHDAQIPRKELQRRLDEIGAELDQDHESMATIIEVMLLTRALGIKHHWDFSRIENPTPLDDLDQLDKLITAESIKNLSRRELRFLRNTIFARRGRPFKSEILQNYFGRMTWYKPEKKYTDARLTKTDNRNIKIVQSVEKEHGGPMSETEHFEAEMAYAGA